MRRWLALLALLIARGLCAQSDPLNSAYQPSIDTNCSHSQYASNVWMTDTMQKIVQTNTTAATNSCYITIHATQGEFGDFQVHVVSPGGGYTGLTIASSSFVCSTGPTCGTPVTIPAPSTSNNNIVVWREFYQPIGINGSTLLTTNGAAAYYSTTGYYPDGLGPNIDPWFHQQTNAFPVAVAANNTQSAWVDIYVPNSAASGYYLGSITVSDSVAGTIATMPVILGVWQWPAAQGGHMPATSSLPTDWGTTSTAIYCDTLYNGDPTGCTPGESGTMAQMATVFLDHRITVADTVQQTMNASPWSYLMSGTANPSYTTILPGAGFTGVPVQQEAYTLQNWWNLYNSEKPTPWATVTSYSYPSSCDEPTSASVSSCVTSGNTAHAITPSPGIPLMMTGIWCDGIASTSSCVSNSTNVTTTIDYWVVEQASECRNTTDGGTSPGCTNELAHYTGWRNGASTTGITRQLWSYESCSSAGTCGNGSKGPSDFNFPNDNIDGRPSSNRALEWMIYMNTEQGELAFANVCTWPGNAGCSYSQSATAQDPWQNTYSFGNNGSATEVLPSTYYCSSASAWAYPQQNCPTGTGYTVNTSPSWSRRIYVGTTGGASLTNPIPLPTIRLKNKRDGFQDYEYLYLLGTTLGYTSEVSTQISSWITDRNEYEYTGSGLQSARTALGNFMHALTYSGSSSGGSAVSTGVSIKSGVTIQ